MTSVENKLKQNLNAFSKKTYFEKHLTAEEQQEILATEGECLNQKIYNYINHITTPKCICGKNLKFKSYKEGYLKYCSNSCKSKNQIRTKEQYEQMKVSFQKTMMEKYGVINPGQLETTKKSLASKSKEFWNKRNEKSKQTFLQNYGVDNPNKCKDIIEKRKQTNLERYGNAFGKPCKTNISKNEKEIFMFLSNLGIDVIHTRSVIAPLELDIYLPKYNIAIEYNGDYWHALHRVDHSIKRKKCEEKNIKLIQIREKDYNLYKDDILENIINLIFNKSYTENFFIFSEKDGFKLQDAFWPPQQKYIGLTEPEKEYFNDELYSINCGKYILI